MLTPLLRLYWKIVKVLNLPFKINNIMFDSSKFQETYLLYIMRLIYSSYIRSSKDEH